MRRILIYFASLCWIASIVLIGYMVYAATYGNGASTYGTAGVIYGAGGGATTTTTISNVSRRHKLFIIDEL